MCTFHSPPLSQIYVISCLAAADTNVCFTESLVFFRVGAIPLRPRRKNRFCLLEPLKILINSIHSTTLCRTYCSLKIKSLQANEPYTRELLSHMVWERSKNPTNSKKPPMAITNSPPYEMNPTTHNKSKQTTSREEQPDRVGAMEFWIRLLITFDPLSKSASWSPF